MVKMLDPSEKKSHHLGGNRRPHRSPISTKDPARLDEFDPIRICEPDTLDLVPVVDCRLGRLPKK
jgi:hypothetical protein